MAQIGVRHVSGDRYEIAVRGHRLFVDQPFQAGGLDTGPTPTELFVASLASCVAHYAGRFLRRHDLIDGDLTVEADFVMSPEAPARVTSIELRLLLPEVPPAIRDGALRAAERCAVHNSLVAPPPIGIHLAAPVMSA